jgi:3-hydroxyisobutyrate dehydrogenase-like beta-hydroxyacid dehydrogenase
MRVAVLGLGRMGQAIAGRLLDTGHDVQVWNRTPGREKDLTARGARVAPSASEAASQADVAITMVTDDAAVREICLGSGGVIDSLQPGAVLVDMSTVSPDTSRALAAAMPNGRFVDAPVLAGPPAIEAGQGLLLIGGAPDRVKQLEPLWNSLTARHIYCGPVGSGATMKLISNLLLVGGVALLSEAVATAQAHGMDDDFLRQVLRQHPMVPAGLHNRLDDVIDGDHAGWFTVTLARKDIRLAMDLAGAAGLHTAMAEATAQVLAQAETSGWNDRDLGAAVEVVRGKSRPE